MNLIPKLKYLLFLSLTLISITSKAQKRSYKATIEAFRTQRITNLKSENGWLNLVGLFWLKEGKNYFGSGSKNDLVFPKGSISNQAGYLVLLNGNVKFYGIDGTIINVNGIPCKEAKVFDKDSQNNPILSYKDLRWTIIKREDKIGVRLRDLKSPLLKSFKGINYYPIDSTWCVNAKLSKPETQNVFITNVLGQTTPQATPGKLTFTLKNKQYTLDALEDDGELFILFADSTNGTQTYHTGRFLKANLPDATGNTILDFNKAYNPPCAFTPYATCPLPPKQNTLPISVIAGEKKYGKH